MVTIPEANIIHRDANGVIRKWIDQKTGDVMEHDCERLSLCCGAEPHEYVDYFCSACTESAGFECIECGARQSSIQGRFRYNNRLGHARRVSITFDSHLSKWREVIMEGSDGT